MSRAYRVSVEGSVQRIVHIKDAVRTTIELLPVLPKERMQQHLSGELELRGFARDGTRARRAMEGGVTVEVALDTGEVTVRIEDHAKVKVRGREERTIGRKPSVAKEQAAKTAIHATLDAKLEAAAAKQADEARQELTKELERRLRDLSEELDTVANRVTAEALKEKAREMGEIEELVEDKETGALTIKVRL